MIDRCTTSPGHGIIKIDYIKVSDKSCLGQKMCMIGTEESINESIIINADSMICDKNK